MPRSETDQFEAELQRRQRRADIVAYYEGDVTRSLLDVGKKFGIGVPRVHAIIKKDAPSIMRAPFYRRKPYPRKSK